MNERQFQEVKQAIDSVWEGEPEDRQELLNDLKTKLIPSVEFMPVSKQQTDRQQLLVDVIMDAIDDFTDHSRPNNIEVMGALEIVKFNYFNLEGGEL